jgi:hypothetical protein
VGVCVSVCVCVCVCVCVRLDPWHVMRDQGGGEQAGSDVMMHPSKACVSIMRPRLFSPPPPLSPDRHTWFFFLSPTLCYQMNYPR